MEPRFLHMCLNTSVAVVGGTLTQSYDAVSDARGYVLVRLYLVVVRSMGGLRSSTG